LAPKSHVKLLGWASGSFIPIFGKGDPMTTDEDSDEEYWNYMRKKVLRDCCATFILKKNFAQVKKREKEGSEKDSSDADKKKIASEEGG